MHDMEDEAMNAILGDLDGVEGREVCSKCGSSPEKMGDDLDKAGKEAGGMKITIEPMSADKAKDEMDMSNLKDEDMDDDGGMPVIL